MPLSDNVADLLHAHAEATPDRVAIHHSVGIGSNGKARYAALTYAELEAQVEALSRALAAIGIGAGVRAAVMVKPGPEFFALMFALFRARAVPVLIDPGIDRRALRACLDEAAPEAFIGIPVAHVARLVLGWARHSVRIVVTVGRRWFWRGHRYDDLLRQGHAMRADGIATVTDSGALAAILFTSGSTGVPKGVEYTHGNFAAQVDMIATAFAMQPGEVDLPTFAPFALFDPALGLTTVLPAMDFARPGRVDPAVLADAIARFGVTTLFGSPAVMRVLAGYGSNAGARFPTVKRVLSAGAPVRPEIVAAVRRLLPEDADFYTPYGATECLPVSVVEGREIETLGARGTASGAGILVGTPLPENTVRIIATDDAVIPDWTGAVAVAAGEIGEITVAGPTVTARYFRRDAQTALAKIREQTTSGSRIVHRMGDLGYFDAHGRLWYVGRKSHRVERAAGVLYPEQVEGILNQQDGVARTALVGIGNREDATAVICVELMAGMSAADWPRLEAALAARAQAHPLTASLRHFIRHPGFPLDIRHNAKIGREKLAMYAARVVPVGDRR